MNIETYNNILDIFAANEYIPKSDLNAYIEATINHVNTVLNERSNGKEVPHSVLPTLYECGKIMEACSIALHENDEAYVYKSNDYKDIPLEIRIKRFIVMFDHSLTYYLDWFV